jgi:hypothetical protein
MIHQRERPRRSINSDGLFTENVAKIIRERGCCIVKDVVSESQALQWKQSLLGYLKNHPDIPGVPPDDPQVWKAYWTPAQVEARSHPSMIACQRAMSRLYSVGPDNEVDLDSQVMYADRFRVRPPGNSYTLPPHLDNGSLERWENEEYSEVYQAIWEGRWEDYDAWDMNHRAEATIDMYGGPGSC